MKLRISKKLIIVALLITTGLATIPIALAVWPFGKATTVFGPEHCDACKGQRPIPDAATQAFLMQYTKVTNKERLGSPMDSIQPGSKVIVCNATHCTTYEMTDSYDWNGSTQEPITTPGGGGGVGGGGAPIGSGCFGNCGGGGGGIVTVGPYQPCQIGAESKGDLCIGEDGRLRPD